MTSWICANMSNRSRSACGCTPKSENTASSVHVRSKRKSDLGKADGWGSLCASVMTAERAHRSIGAPTKLILCLLKALRLNQPLSESTSARSGPSTGGSNRQVALLVRQKTE